MWDLTEVSLDTEQEQVLSRMSATLAAMPDPSANFSDISDAVLATGDVPIVVSTRMQRHYRHLYILSCRVAEVLWNILER